MRNSDLLEADCPLLINLPADGLLAAYLEEYPGSKITCFNNNFEQYQQLRQSQPGKVELVFDSHYTNTKKHDLVIIAFPKSKAELAYTLAMVNPQLAENTRILVVGENKGGVKSTAKLAADYLHHIDKIDSARHCTLFAGQANTQLPAFDIHAWFKQYKFTLGGIELEIASLPGVFSQNALDKGTELLLNHLPATLAGEVLDFGCGAGVISCFIGKKYPQAQLALLDVSALALASAEKTLALNGLSGKTFPSNSLSEVKGKYQHIVSNPPFHQGVKTHYAATENFLRQIKGHLKPKGNITIVANNFLSYKPIMETAIGMTTTLANEKGFAIYHSQLK
ncbi:class I SAM-dependent methyltransferase [Thalassomonas viridans]|uniref:Ribosomal RNA small subunit methyltransferase C n=2 Tax=Thalassomonas viridans TaxID=137584 RepID=A0AAE9ZBK7_9GAMM|nr:class I SAM-dependent methyltransferase [Thalassomonas viridans]